MLKFIALNSNKKIILLFIILLFSKSLSANTVIAKYEIVWNKILLGAVSWKFKLDGENYEFNIEMESKGFSSKLYSFYGQQFARGLVIDNRFIPIQYTHVWKTKKKDRSLKIVYDNGKIISFELVPKPNQKPKVDFYKINELTDPLSAVLQLIMKSSDKIVSGIFDGRRTYDLRTSPIKNGLGKDAKKSIKISKYELEVLKYKNIWKDHNNKDLKKIIITTKKINQNLVIPISFKIYNKGLVISVNLLEHKLLTM